MSGVCRCCRSPVAIESPPSHTVAICTVCWSAGDGREWWDSHRRDEGRLLLVPREDGDIPDRLTADRDPVEVTMTFEAGELQDD